MRSFLTYPNKKYFTTVTVKVKFKNFPQNWLYWEGFRSIFALNSIIPVKKYFKNAAIFLTSGAFFCDLLYVEKLPS
jgi:putative alpha-1,2-mannosidase